MNTIKAFVGQYRFLSNFYPSPIIWNDWRYTTAEHLFQARKTMTEKDRELIRKIPSPKQAKSLGGTVKLRPDWEEVKLQVMKNVLKLKFTQNPELFQKLISTGFMELEEGNCWHDNYWGICKCRKCKYKKGQNHLGLLLMEVRKGVSE